MARELFIDAYKIREAKFKTSLRVGFLLDFRNFIFASSAARIKKYLWVINI